MFRYTQVTFKEKKTTKKYIKDMIKQSYYRPEQALRVPGG